MVVNEVLFTSQPPLYSDGMYNDRMQNWGRVGNRGIDTRRLNGLGYITNEIIGPFDGAGLRGERTALALGLGAIGLTVSIAAPLYGAYRGAKRSPGWAAGGAAIGMVAGAVVSGLIGLMAVGAASPTP